MKVIILAGGLCTRLFEETQVKPKPMVEIGGYPIIWHIMKIYSHYGYNEFIPTLGYQGEIIKDFFLNYKKFLTDKTKKGLNEVEKYLLAVRKIDKTQKSDSIGVGKYYFKAFNKKNFMPTNKQK